MRVLDKAVAGGKRKPHYRSVFSSSKIKSIYGVNNIIRHTKITLLQRLLRKKDADLGLHSATAQRPETWQEVRRRMRNGPGGQMQGKGSYHPHVQQPRQQ